MALPRLLRALALLLFVSGNVAHAQYSLFGTLGDDGALKWAHEALNRQDYDAALDLLRPLVRSGNKVAQHNMGVMFAYGHGVPQDYDAAQAFFRMAAGQGYAQSFRSLGLMFAQGEGVRPDLVEAYKWFELARRQFERDGAASPDHGLWSDVEHALGKLAAVLTPEQVETSRSRAGAWTPDDWRRAAHQQRLQQIKSLKDYNDTCQSYSHIERGIRSVDDLIWVEALERRHDLLTCLAFVDYSRMTKDCDDREPRVNEMLFYLRFLALKPEEAQRLPAQAAAATALVIGAYCKSNQPLAPGAEAVFARLRKAYEAKVEPKLTGID